MSATRKELIYALVGLRTHYFDFIRTWTTQNIVKKQQIKFQLYIKSICGTSCSFSTVSLHFLSLSPVARNLTNELWSSNSGSFKTCIEIKLFSHDAVAWGVLHFETHPVPSLRPPAWLITHWDFGSDVVFVRFQSVTRFLDFRRKQYNESEYNSVGKSRCRWHLCDFKCLL